MKSTWNDHIVMFCNREHAPYKISIYTANIPQIKWLHSYIADQSLGGGVWEFTYSGEEGTFVILLSKEAAKDPLRFMHRLHEAANLLGFDTLWADDLNERDRFLRA